MGRFGEGDKMIDTPVPVEELQNPEGEKKPLLRLDLGCGQNKMEGFVGVDFADIEGVDIVHDLREMPWPFDSDSVDEARAIHFYEHLDGKQRVEFMNELWRVLKVGSGCILAFPAPYSSRYYQDWTHKWPPVVDSSFYYFNQPWLKANKLDHGDYLDVKCNFNAQVTQHYDPAIQLRNEEFKLFAGRHYNNSLTDLSVLLIKQPMPEDDDG
jgi:hypothetical protein